MKISKFLAALLISTSLFAFSATKASAHEREPVRGGGMSGGTCMALPINGQAWFLLVAGLGIGSYVVLNKTKQVEAETAPVKR